jgi:hypothetical protein
MSFRQLAARRRASGLAGTALILLILALAADGMIAGGRTDPRLFHLLPGQSINLSDPMPRGAQRLEDLALASDSPVIATHMLETFSGFWLGGVLWRAEAAVAPDAPTGEYALAMRYVQNATETEPPQRFRIRVHTNAASIRAASLSATIRATGLSPYLLAACLLPLTIAPMWACYVLSRRIARELAAENTAEIYRAMADKDGQLIFFSLPQSAGLKPGSSIAVLDEHAEKILGTALVTELKGQDVRAAMQNGGQVRPGSLARPA